ncbi:uncharacterized protein DS421_10g307220 [Arachis hypogaea]|nr:uncharacterized protein DS421_10g307220 [Arachis hypogaea]
MYVKHKILLQTCSRCKNLIDNWVGTTVYSTTNIVSMTQAEFYTYTLIINLHNSILR